MMKDKRKYCEHCKSTFSRSYYYALGHNKGLCLQKTSKKKAQTVTTHSNIDDADGMQDDIDFTSTLIKNDNVSVADVLESFTEEPGNLFSCTVTIFRQAPSIQLSFTTHKRARHTTFTGLKEQICLVFFNTSSFFS